VEGVVRVSLSGILFSMLSARKGDGGRGGLARVSASALGAESLVRGSVEALFGPAARLSKVRFSGI
jgi:hypothetical protein